MDEIECLFTVGQVLVEVLYVSAGKTQNSPMRYMLSLSPFIDEETEEQNTLRNWPVVT